MPAITTGSRMCLSRRVRRLSHIGVPFDRLRGPIVLANLTEHPLALTDALEYSGRAEDSTTLTAHCSVGVKTFALSPGAT